MPSLYVGPYLSKLERHCIKLGRIEHPSPRGPPVFAYWRRWIPIKLVSAAKRGQPKLRIQIDINKYWV